jgi:hypothetical protein
MPSKEELQAKARHFANTVFVIGAGVIMLAASLLQPYAMKWVGAGMGEHFPFIAATIFIFVPGQSHLPQRSQSKQ